MAITYVKKKYGKTDIKIPVLHRVVYGYIDNPVDQLYHRGWLLRQVDVWLEANCRSPYYHSPGYLEEKFIEFEDDEEAVLFALRWA